MPTPLAGASKENVKLRQLETEKGRTRAGIEAEILAVNLDFSAAASEHPILRRCAVAIETAKSTKVRSHSGWSINGAYICTGVPLEKAAPLTSRHFALLPLG